MFYYLCAAWTTISAAVSLGFSIQAYTKAKPQYNEARTNAKYAISRSFALFILSLGLFVFTSEPYLVALTTIMILVQLFDGIIGIKINLLKTLGPLLTAFGNFYVLVVFLLTRILESS